jgi:2-iminobutanoate/2-iminopropanoate deaminase
VQGGFVFVAGQLGIDPANPGAAPGTIEQQTERVLKNIAAILEEAGSALNRVVQVTVFISDMELWSRVNDVYARVLGDHRPARAVVPVKDLRHGHQIEVQVIAAAGRST